MSSSSSSHGRPGAAAAAAAAAAGGHHHHPPTTTMTTTNRPLSNATSTPAGHAPHPHPHHSHHYMPPDDSNVEARSIPFDLGWETISDHGIQKLISMLADGMDGKKAFSTNEYVELYTTVYIMCTQRIPRSYTPELYAKYELTFKQYMLEHCAPALASKSNEFLLKELVRRWDDHQIMTKWMGQFFRYLDRFYVARAQKKPLADFAASCFKELVFEPFAERITHAILGCVRNDRAAESIDRDLLTRSCKLFVEVCSIDEGSEYHSSGSSGGGHALVSSSSPASASSTSSTSAASSASASATSSTASSATPPAVLSGAARLLRLEQLCIAESKQFYMRESAVWLVNDSCVDYLRKVEKCIQEERSRLASYLVFVPAPAMMSILCDVLLHAPQADVLQKENTGFRAMLESQALQDVSRVYRLYSLYPDGVVLVASMFKDYVLDVGKQLMEKMSVENDTTLYVDEVIKMHERFADITKTCFNSHAAFQKAMKEAFENLINTSVFELSNAEILATYSDGLLKKGGTRLSDKQLLQCMENVVRLFSYLTDKDLFSEFYRKMLASRLLMQRSASTDAEKTMIGKLKLCCGAFFTTKMEGMINDMRNASEFAGEFQQFLVDRRVQLRGIEFSVQTLTTGFWPSYPMDELKLPAELNDCINAFKVYYDSKTSNRRVRWIHDLGQVTLAATYGDRKVDLVLSTVQASLLLLFNTRSEMTISWMTEQTQLTPEAIKAQLKSLVNGKYKLLNKVPADGYAPSHVIEVNKAFSQPLRVLRIPNAVRKTTTKDRDGANKAIQEDRKFAIEASVVRVMKSRKTMMHQQLVAEVSAQLMQYFKPDPRAIKQRIEDLIQREYMRRDAEASNKYHYVA